MRALLKVIAWIVGVLVAVVIAAVVLIPIFVNPNDYKPQIEALVKAKTGRQLTLQGDIKLSVFPWLGLRLGPTRLSNPPGFPGAPFAKVASGELRVKLLPLLDKRVELGTVVLDGLVLNLERNRNGRTNWAGFGRPGVETRPTSTESARGGGVPPVEAPPIAALAIGGVRVLDATLRWDDRRSGARVEVRNLNLTTGAIRPGRSFHVALGFALTGKDLPKPGVKVRLRSAVTFDLGRRTLTLKGLVVDLGDLHLTGDVSGTQVLSAPHLRGRFKIADFDPRRLFPELGLPVPRTADPKALTNASAELGFVSTPDRLTVDPLRLTLDDTHLTGRFAVRRFARPSVSFALDVDRLDLDRYLPPPAKGRGGKAPAGRVPAVPATPGGAAAAGAAGTLPVGALRKFDLEGTLRIGELTAFKLHSKDLRVTVRSRNGDLRVHPATARLYGGTYSGDIGLNAGTRVPRLSMNEHLEGVQVGALVRDLAGVRKVSGTGDLYARLTARGDDVARLRRTLDGKVGLALKNGVFEGVNLTHVVCTAWALYKRRPPPPAALPRTEFGSLTATAAITGGVLRNRDLLLTSPVLRATGAGTANLVNRTLDYGIEATFLDPVQCGAGAPSGRLKGLTVPVRVTGTFRQPRFRVDLAAVLKNEVRRKVERKLERQLRKKLPKGIPRGLENLFR